LFGAGRAQHQESPGQEDGHQPAALGVIYSKQSKSLNPNALSD
jgi:hypothetical protein